MFAESSNGRMQRSERCHVGSSPASAVANDERSAAYWLANYGG